MSIGARELADAAFGVRPDLWPLPAAHSAVERWHRAVAAGGQGRYAGALADLDALARAAETGPLTSLAHSTRASFLRQLGGHAAARGWDGRAWAHAGGDPDATADALTGLAADALGTGRFGLSARLLDRARTRAVDATARISVRVEWVASELAMVTGDGATAVRHADRAVELAASAGSARHAVKSDVVRAAALCSHGEIDASRQVADAALTTARELGLVPLSWALACLLGDVGSAVLDAAEIVALRDECADDVRRRGGTWSVR